MERKINSRRSLSDLPLLKWNWIRNSENSSSAKTSYQKIMRRNSKHLYNHVSTSHTKQTVDIVALVPEGGNYKLLPSPLKQTRNFHVAWTRLHRSKPSPTIDTGHRHHFHPTRIESQQLEIRTYPILSWYFQILGSKTSQYNKLEMLYLHY